MLSSVCLKYSARHLKKKKKKRILVHRRAGEKDLEGGEPASEGAGARGDSSAITPVGTQPGTELPTLQQCLFSLWHSLQKLAGARSSAFSAQHPWAHHPSGSPSSWLCQSEGSEGRKDERRQEHILTHTPPKNTVFFFFFIKKSAFQVTRPREKPARGSCRERLPAPAPAEPRCRLVAEGRLWVGISLLLQHLPG